MTLSSLDVVYGQSLIEFATAALRTAMLAGGIGLLLRIFKIRDTSARLFLWTAVAYIGLGMPILGSLLPPLSISVPKWYLPAQTIGSGGPVLSYAEYQSANGIVTTVGREVSPHRIASLPPVFAEHARQNPLRLLPWGTVIIALYIGVAALLAIRLFLGTMATRNLVHSCQEICDGRLGPYLAAFRASRVRVLESSSVSVPLTVGITSSSILLPTEWRDWDRPKLHAVMTHELSHVSRHDTVSQFAALLHRAIFWFSPLAWWLNRHIADLSEQASDEATLAAGIERACYARTLLGFLQAANGSSGRIQWQGVSMATPGQAEKRLEKVLAWRGANSMRINRTVIAVIFALAVPSIYLAAAARPVPRAVSAQQTTTSSPATPDSVGTPGAPAVSENAPSAPSASPADTEDDTVDAPAAPAPATTAIAASRAAELAHVDQENSNHRQGFHYGFGFDDEQRFVIVSGKSDGFTMSGSGEDARHVQNLRKTISGDFIWFQRDEKSYVIRDQATVQRALALWAPQEKLGKQQEELGKQQEVLGKQQEELGERMRAIRVQVPDMTAEIEKLKAELKALGPNASMEQIGDVQEHIGELQSKLGELQSHAGDDQGKLGSEMGKLGEQQGKLGEQQGELGRQQGELAEKATKEMKQLLDDAIQKGTAQPEAQTSGGASL
jgi:beta-lactamase regulating signal transducer with metallopeptidase domain